MTVSRIYIISFCLLLTIGPGLNAQFKLKGTVYDSTKMFPIEAVSVLTSSGRGAVTNENGKYEILVNEKDSVWFSYLNKPTPKYPVSNIYNESQFDIALHIRVPVLTEIKLRQRNYRMDSIQNRIDYAKVFNYEKARITPSVTNSGVGFDLNELIRMFQFKKNRSMLSFQKRLLDEEQENYINHRFNKGLVARLTGLTGAAADSFMALFRPEYEKLLLTPEYEFQLYIKKAFEEYSRLKNKQAAKKEEAGF